MDEPADGKHLKILFRASTRSLESAETVQRFLSSLASVLGFETQGVWVAADRSGQVVGSQVLPTSHVVLHTWQDRQEAILDIYSGQKFRSRDVLRVIREGFEDTDPPRVFDLSWALRDGGELPVIRDLRAELAARDEVIERLRFERLRAELEAG